jgi:hypothetical protein
MLYLVGWVATKLCWWLAVDDAEGVVLTEWAVGYPSVSVKVVFARSPMRWRLRHRRGHGQARQCRLRRVDADRQVSTCRLLWAPASWCVRRGTLCVGVRWTWWAVLLDHWMDGFACRWLGR